MGENFDQSFENEKVKQERVKIIERLSVGSTGKAGLILIALGLKPAMDLSLSRHTDSQEVVKEALCKAGLVFANKDVKGRKNVIVTIAVARDQEILDELLKLSPKEDHVAYGRLMGFPETAVQAFITKDLLARGDFPPEMADNIFPMMLSKGHWREEMENLRAWNEAIKKYSPDTYKQARGRESK